VAVLAIDQRRTRMTRVDVNAPASCGANHVACADRQAHPEIKSHVSSSVRGVVEIRTRRGKDCLGGNLDIGFGFPAPIP
jgi:hypothetical protein